MLRICGCLIIQSIQGQTGWDFELPDLVKDVSAQGRGVRLDDLGIILCKFCSSLLKHGNWHGLDLVDNDLVGKGLSGGKGGETNHNKLQQECIKQKKK